MPIDIVNRFLVTAQKLTSKIRSPFYRAIDGVQDGVAVVDGEPLVMVGSNDYLGLRTHPKVQEAAIAAIRRWGTGPGGARILCGNLTLHEELEHRLAALVGKKGAIVYTTGFLANIGALQTLCGPDCFFLCDQESHASLYEGGWASRARVVPFDHNNVESARQRLARTRSKVGDKDALLVTEGVFSMSGDIANLEELVQFKNATPGVKLYLDDAHGLGVVGAAGAGTASLFGLTGEVDYLMGTFSKSLASIGGFIATDEVEMLQYLKHQSKAMLFTAALPAASAAAVLAALDVLEQEPERIEHLRKITERARDGYIEIGLDCGKSNTPIIPVVIGDEEMAMCVSEELRVRGVYALPAMYPAVPKGRAIIRTAYSSAHTKEQVDLVVDAFYDILKHYPIAKK